MSSQLAADNANRFHGVWKELVRMQREMVLHLRHDHGMSYKAIEQRTGLSYRQVTRIVREADDE